MCEEDHPRTQGTCLDPVEIYQSDDLQRLQEQDRRITKLTFVQGDLRRPPTSVREMTKIMRIARELPTYFMY